MTNRELLLQLAPVQPAVLPLAAAGVGLGALGALDEWLARRAIRTPLFGFPSFEEELGKLDREVGYAPSAGPSMLRPGQPMPSGVGERATKPYEFSTAGTMADETAARIADFATTPLGILSLLPPAAAGRAISAAGRGARGVGEAASGALAASRAARLAGERGAVLAPSTETLLEAATRLLARGGKYRAMEGGERILWPAMQEFQSGKAVLRSQVERFGEAMKPATGGKWVEDVATPAGQAVIDVAEGRAPASILPGEAEIAAREARKKVFPDLYRKLIAGGTGRPLADVGEPIRVPLVNAPPKVERALAGALREAARTEPRLMRIVDTVEVVPGPHTTYDRATRTLRLAEDAVDPVIENPGRAVTLARSVADSLRQMRVSPRPRGAPTPWKGYQPTIRETPQGIVSDLGARAPLEMEGRLGRTKARTGDLGPLTRRGPVAAQAKAMEEEGLQALRFGAIEKIAAMPGIKRLPKKAPQASVDALKAKGLAEVSDEMVGDLHKWGALSGYGKERVFIPSALKELLEEGVFGAGKRWPWQPWVSAIKAGFTSLRPTSVVRQLPSNFIYADLAAGLGPRHPASSAESMMEALDLMAKDRKLFIGKPLAYKPHELIREATQERVLGTTWRDSFLNDEGLTDVLGQRFAPDVKGGKYGGAVWAIGDAIANNKLTNTAGAVYAFPDNWMKLSTFIHLRKQGMSAAQAGERIRTWFPFYPDVAEVARVIEESPVGFPFAAFQVENARILATAATQPKQAAKLASWYLMYRGARAAGMQATKARTGLSEEQIERKLGEKPGEQLIPVPLAPGKRGDLAAIEAHWLNPFGDFSLLMADPKRWRNEKLGSNIALSVAYGAATGEDIATGKPIASGAREKLYDYPATAWFRQKFMPNIPLPIPESMGGAAPRDVQRLIDSYRGASYAGSPAEAKMRFFGLPITRRDPRAPARMRMMDLGRERRDAVSSLLNLRRMLDEGRITREEYLRAVAKTRTGLQEGR